MDQKTPERSGLHERLFPKVATDHGGLDAGDILVSALSLFLMGFTVFFSWDFLQRSLPADYKFLAVAGLAGLDVGVIFWTLTWIFGSTSKGQDATAMGMLVTDYIGVAITTVVGFLSNRGSTVPSLLQTVALYGVIGVVLVNFGAGIIYHLTSPKSTHRRAMRKMVEKLEADRQRAELELRRMGEELAQDKEYIARKSVIVDEEEKLSAQKIKLDAIDKRNREAMDSASRPGGQQNRPNQQVGGQFNRPMQPQMHPVSFDAEEGVSDANRMREIAQRHSGDGQNQKNASSPRQK